MGCGGSQEKQETVQHQAVTGVIPKNAKVLVINASGRTTGSTSRQITAQLAEGFRTKFGATITERDVGNSKVPLPTVDDDMIDSFFAQGERTAAQKAAVAFSDELVAEVQAADVLIVGTPVYNFGPAAALKVYADLIARAGLTFTYTSDGPQGLLKDKKVYFASTSGGVPLNSEMDHMSPWLNTFFNFIGITDQTVIPAVGHDGLKDGTDAVEKILKGEKPAELAPKKNLAAPAKEDEEEPVKTADVNVADQKKILVINASGRTTGSVSRQLTAQLAEGLKNKHGATITERDVGNSKVPLPTVTDDMIDSFFAQGERTAAQKAAVAFSDELVAEVVAADILIVGTPVYNFGPAAALKVYADLIARAGLTFTYTSEGPQGLLKDKKVYFASTSGGTPLNSEMDHMSPWLTTFFNFIGITDQTVIAATGQGEAPLKAGSQAIEKILQQE